MSAEPRADGALQVDHGACDGGQQKRRRHLPALARAPNERRSEHAGLIERPPEALNPRRPTDLRFSCRDPASESTPRQLSATPRRYHAGVGRQMGPGQLQARVELRALRAHRDAERAPRRSPSALRSSSTSGQWIPAPSPRSSKRARCSRVALRRRGNQARGVARRRPSARTTTSSSSVTVTSLIRGSTLGIEKATPCLLELVPSFLDDALNLAEFDRREPGTGC